MRTLLNILIGIIIGVSLERAGVPLDRYWPFKYWPKQAASTSSATPPGTVRPTRVIQSSRLKKTDPARPRQAKAKTPRPSPKVKASLYAVQIASFQTLPQAKAFLAALSQKQIDAYLAPLTEESPRWYRVYVGEYVNKADAMKKLSQLRRNFPKAFLRGF